VSEPKSIRLRDRDVAYLLKRSQQRRSIMLSVDEHGLTVSAPWRSSERRIVGVIRDAEEWVLKKLDVWSAFPARNQSWIQGDKVRYLGRDLSLHLTTDTVATLATLQDGGRLHISLADPAHKDSVKTAVVKWYRRHAQSNFSDRIGEFCTQTRRARTPPLPFQRADALGELQRTARSPAELAADPGRAVDDRLCRRSRAGPSDRDESLAAILEAGRVRVSALSRSLRRTQPHGPLLHGHLNWSH